MDFAKIIFETVREAGIPPVLASLIVAQAKHETNNFTSNVFTTCKNAFGYKAVFGAPACTQSPEGNSYRRYETVSDSAKEIAAWIKRRQSEGKFPSDLSSITTPERYASLLKNTGYYGAPLSEYLSGLLRWWAPILTPTIALLDLLLIVAAIWVVTQKK